ncbi:uroporphyrinogen decarboxylase family protein, partial [Actinomycetota bacterium]
GDGKIDITSVSDDFGTQKGLMISIDMFKKYFKEQYIKLNKLAKSYDIKVFHHDDGSIMDLIPELIECRIDILNPIQWHLPGMDLNKLKQDFGNSICFHGGIDNQNVLPFGTPKDVEKEVSSCIEVLAGDKTGYILAPCHNIQVNTSVENILKMYETAKIVGRF